MRSDTVSCRGTQLETGNLVPKFRSAVEVDRSQVIFKATDGSHHFARSQGEATGAPGQVEPIGSIKKGSLLGIFVQTLAITEVESKIIEIMEKLDSPTASIPGIGTMSAATIIAEYGDVSRFANDGQMLAYAGLDCGRYQSGTSDFPGRMVKHGSGYLRQALMNVAETCMMHVPSFYDYYLKKRNEGKSHRVALSHIARKLVRLIYKLETSHTHFDLSVFNSQHQ